MPLVLQHPAPPAPAGGSCSAPLARSSPFPRFSIFIKGEGAGLKPSQRGHPCFNSLDPSTGEIRIQLSRSRQFGDCENSGMRAAMQHCTADPAAEVLLGVYDGEAAGGRRIYYPFSARILREDTEKELFVGVLKEPLDHVPGTAAEQERQQRAAASAASAQPAAAAPLARGPLLPRPACGPLSPLPPARRLLPLPLPHPPARSPALLPLAPVAPSVIIRN